MRCPKCGYISFDHLETCLKCNKNIKSTSDDIQGTVYHVTAPAFLKFSTESEFSEVDMPGAFIDDDDVFADDEIRDPDLDILLDEGEEDDEIQIRTGREEKRDVDISIAEKEEEEEGEISFSLDDFDDEVDLSDSDDIADSSRIEKPLNLGLPEELSDISDLEPPPALKEVVEDSVAASDDDFSLDFNFDLNLDDDDLGSATPVSKESKHEKLSLDDLEYEDEPVAVTTKKKAASNKMDIDDLNFELDLGDLHLDDDDKI